MVRDGLTSAINANLVPRQPSWRFLYRCGRTSWSFGICCGICCRRLVEQRATPRLRFLDAEFAADLPAAAEELSDKLAKKGRFDSELLPWLLRLPRRFAVSKRSSC